MHHPSTIRMHNKNDNVREFEKYTILVGRRRLYSKTVESASVRFVTKFPILARSIKVNVAMALPWFTKSFVTRLKCHFKQHWQNYARYFSAVKSETSFYFFFFRGREASSYAWWRQEELEPSNFSKQLSRVLSGCRQLEDTNFYKPLPHVKSVFP